MESDGEMTMGEVASLLHTILFAYQKKQRDILGRGSRVFIRPVLETIKEINRRRGVNLIKGESLEDVFQSFAESLIEAQVVENAEFQKEGSESYVFHVEGCNFAEEVHPLLDPKDVTCPWALIAMAIFTSKVRGKINVASSEYTRRGSKTIIKTKVNNKTFSTFSPR